MKMSEITLVSDMQQFMLKQFLYVVDMVYPYKVHQTKNAPWIFIDHRDAYRGKINVQIDGVVLHTKSLSAEGRDWFRLGEEGEVFDDGEEATRFSLEKQTEHLQQELERAAKQLAVFKK